MHVFITATFIVSFAVAVTIHQVLMKSASYHQDVWWYAYMGLGYAIGIVPPICMAMAFRGNNPVVIMAIAGAVATPISYTTLLLTFEHKPLSWIQWLGIALIFIGTLLIPLGPIRDADPEGDNENSATIVSGGEASKTPIAPS